MEPEQRLYYAEEMEDDGYLPESDLDEFTELDLFFTKSFLKTQV